MNKFSKLSIYDLDYKIKDKDGEEHTFNFKPLPFRFYPELFKILAVIQKYQGDDENALFQLLSDDSMASLLNLELEMVKNSFPDLSDEDAERFVSSNCFQLIEPLLMVTVGNEEAKNELQTKS